MEDGQLQEEVSRAKESQDKWAREGRSVDLSRSVNWSERTLLVIPCPTTSGYRDSSSNWSTTSMDESDSDVTLHF